MIPISCNSDSFQPCCKAYQGVDNDSGKEKAGASKTEISAFSFIESVMEEDGPMMVYLILNEVQPETTVGISGLKDKLGSVDLAKFSHNINYILDHIQSLYEEVLENNMARDDNILHIFRALNTCSNPDLLSVLRFGKDTWESGTTYTFDSLKEFTIKKYNNLGKYLLGGSKS